MKIAIGSDHAGFRYKEKIKQYLAELGHEVTDFGTDSEEPVDYPLFIRPVALAVAAGEVERGIVVGREAASVLLCEEDAFGFANVVTENMPSSVQCSLEAEDMPQIIGRWRDRVVQPAAGRAGFAQAYRPGQT